MSEGDKSIGDVYSESDVLDPQELERRLEALKQYNGDIKRIMTFFQGLMPEDLARELYEGGYRMNDDGRRLVAPGNGNDKIKK